LYSTDVILLDRKKALLITNPHSGLDRTRVSAEEVVESLSSAEIDFTVEETKGPCDATNIIMDKGDNHDIVICCGGDGTLNETINGVMKLEKKPTVGYIPLGSTNDLASTLGIPVGLGSATNIILNGKTNTYDVGRFNDRYFNYIASFGIASDLAYATPQKLKNVFGHEAYVIYAWFRMFHMLFGFKPTQMKVEYDGGVIEDKVYFGAISNTTSVGAVFKYDNVKLNDGYFEMLIVKGVKRTLDMLGLLSKIIRKDYSGDNIVFTKTKKVKITCEEKVPWTLDGEFGGDVGDVDIEVIHDAYNIFSDNDKMFV